MTGFELYTQLERLLNMSPRALDYPVVVEITEPFATIGPRPTILIERIYTSFDWDANKLLLKPAEELERVIQ